MTPSPRFHYNPKHPNRRKPAELSRRDYAQKLARWPLTPKTLSGTCHPADGGGRSAGKTHLVEIRDGRCRVDVGNISLQ
jgi:hypothetical protein